MQEKKTAALLSLGINIISACLCIPTDYPVLSGFYRSVILYIINVFMTEIPKFTKNKTQSNGIRYFQYFLFLCGFVLIGIGFVNISQPAPNNLPQKVTGWVWAYFIVSLGMLVLSAISAGDVLFSDSKKNTPIPPVVAINPQNTP